MEFEGTTYRPPPEADSMLLQVTVGCAHNRCAFCNMYRDVRFRVIKMDQIEKDIREARGIYPKSERVFLVNGDAFVLKADRLKEISQKIMEYFPECQTISMYASINNIKGKTDEELKELKKQGIDDLYVGVESGSEEVLSRINKGNTVEEAKRELHRLNDAGISHIANIVLGLAGAGNGIENARRSASFINETRPKAIWIGTLTLFEGTRLFEEDRTGIFNRASEMEILLEEKNFLESVSLQNVRLYGNHPTNTIPISGILPWDKERMISAIDAGIAHIGKPELSRGFHRATL